MFLPCYFQLSLQFLVTCLVLEENFVPAHAGTYMRYLICGGGQIVALYLGALCWHFLN